MPVDSWMNLFFLSLAAGITVLSCRWYYSRRWARKLSDIKNLYEPIIELSNQLFYDYNVIDGSISWSGAITKVTGFDPDEFQSVDIDRWTNLIHPQDLPAAIAQLDVARANVSRYNVNYRFCQKSGDYRYFEDEGQFFPGPDGKAIRMLGAMKDVTQRKAAERLLQKTHAALQRLNAELEDRVMRRTRELTVANRRLRKSEERFRTVFEYVTIGMCLTNVEGRYLMVNRTLCDMLGYREVELLQKSYREITDPADADHSYRMMQRLMRGEKVASVHETRYRHKTGHVVWAMVGSYLLHDSRGRPQHFIFHIHDITHRKNSEAEVQRLHTAIEQAGEGVAITAPDQSIAYINPAFARITGYAAAEIIGRHPRCLSGRQPHARFYSEIGRTLQSGQVWRGRMRHHSKNGRPVWVEASISPIYGIDGGLIGYVAVIRDVTARERLEKRLRQTQKMEAIGTLAGGIAHDFNNILGGILGCSEMALTDIPTGNPAREDLKQIIEASRRAKGLIKRILTFSRQGESEMSPVQIGPVIEETVKLMGVSMPANIDVRLDIAPNVGAVMADAVQIQQIVMNLCTNAMQAMRDQGGLLQVTLTETSQEMADAIDSSRISTKQGLCLMVADNGQGIAPNIVERIFDPFFTTRKVGDGTGLGLSVVHGIVKRHAGLIHVDSQIGRGSRFQVWLPTLGRQIEIG